MARRPWTHEQLVAGVRAGDHRALARSISLVENRDPGALAVVQELYPETGSTFAVGITGPPGVGKSSLIGALVRHVRGLELSVGVISVDPSSPFTQGALLGDRIRLADHFLDPGVFIRSMGTRGHLGGLAEATLQSLLLLDAAGRDVVFLETVGTGQSEVEVMSIADEVVLVLMPGSGDSVQALKAGIMEIPDVIAINKMDQPGAKAMLNDIRIGDLARPGAGASPRDRPHGGGSRGRRRRALECARRAARLGSPRPGELEERRRRNLAGEVVSAATARARTAIEKAIADDPALGGARRRRAAARGRSAHGRRPHRRGRAAGGRGVTRPTLADIVAARGAPGGGRAASRPCSRPARSAASSAAPSRSRPRTSSSPARSRFAAPTTRSRS